MDMDDFIPVIAIGGGLMVAIVIIIGSIIQNVLRTKAREVSRREIAAYVAEGSMSAEEGERLLRAGLSSRDSKRC